VLEGKASCGTRVLLSGLVGDEHNSIQQMGCKTQLLLLFDAEKPVGERRGGGGTEFVSAC